MMLVQVGSTDVTTYFQLRNVADGTDATGKTITDFDLQYVRSGATPAAKVDAVAHGAANDAHSDGEMIEVDATDTPGLYRVDWPDAAFASGVREVILTVKHADIFTESLRVQLVGCDPASVTRGFAGTALPAAAADAAGGLPISDAGGLDLDALQRATNIGTAQAGATGSITLAAAASSTTSAYLYSWVVILSGTGAGQARFISQYVGSTRVASVTPDWTTNPDNTSVYAVYPAAGVDLETWRGIQPNAVTGGRVESFVSLMNTDVITATSIAADAITAAKIAADAITNAKIADNAIAAENIASDTFTTAKFADGFLTTAKLGANFFDAVWAVATRLLTAGTNIVLAKDTGVTGFNDLSAAAVNAEVDTAIADAALATAAAVDDLQSDVDGIGVILTDLTEDDGGTFRFTENALEEGPSGGGSAPTVEEIRDEIDSNSTQLAAIKAKTDQLGFTEAGQVDANIQFINGQEIVGDGAGTPFAPA